MKNKKAIGVAVASALALALCGGALVGCGDEPTTPKKLTDKALEATKIADFETGNADDRKAVFASDGFENGDVFNTWWSSENVSYDNGMAELTISEMAEKEKKWNPDYDAEEAENNPDYDVPQYIDCQAKYYGGEMRSSEYYGYGDYEVCMKPSNVKGTASTFFVCTGDYDVNYETKVPNPHDEVDIEFLGKDTTKVQFNYFIDDVGQHEYMYDLGFDASKEFHTYGFRWTAEYIVWFVDGKPVYKVEATKKNPMPSTPGRILTNYWTGTTKAENWMKKFDNDYSGKAQYKYIATSATAQPDPTKAPEEPPIEDEVPETGWTDIDYSGFGDWEMYTVSTEEGINISHESKPDGYDCCGMDLASNYSWVKFKITNNSEEDGAVVRVDIKKKTPSTAGIVGVVSEHEGVSYLGGDKAALIELAAGDEAEVVCKINDKVNVNQLVVFLNSSNGATATAGNITISELKGIEAEEGEEPGPEEPSTMDTEVNAEVLIGDNKVSFEGTGYNGSVSDDNKALTLSYENLVGDSYKNISGDVSEIIGDNNVFTVTIKNDGENTAKVRLDIICPADAVHKDGTFSNLKAEYEGEIVDKGNDYQWGGADWVKIGAGKTITAKITFKAGVGSNAVTLFVDSSTYQDSDKHTGSIVFSNMSFSKETVVEVQPTLPDGTGWTAIELNAISAYVPGEGNTNVYTHEVSANSVHITHSAKPVAGSNLNVSPDYGTNNFVHMKIKNNLDAAYAIRVNVQSPDAGYKTVILSAKVDGEAIEVPSNTYDGITVDLAANAEIVLEFFVGGGANNLCFGVNNMDTGAESGDVTISEICMKADTYVAPPVEGATLPEGDGWSAIDLAGVEMYPGDNKYTATADANSVTISHTELPTENGSINHLVTYGDNRIVHFEVTNNGEVDAVLKVFAQNTTAWDEQSGNLTVDGTATDSKIVTIEAGATLVIEFTVTDAAGNICFCLNGTGEDRAATGDITISKLAMKAPAAE